MNDEMTAGRVEAVQEITTALFKAAGAELIRHGNDPQAEMILGTAVAMFVERTDERVSPGFKRRLIALLR